MNLNPGGLIGAFSFAGGAVAITMALNVETAGVAKIFVPALVVGAFAGNFVWTLLFPGADVGERRHRKKQEAQFDYDDDEEAANGGRRPPSKSRMASQKPVVPGQGMKQFGALLVFICMACLMIGGSVVAIFFPEMRGRGS